MSDTPPTGRFTIVLAKEDFKFSCAHFTLFGAERAELLHGHNYRVRVEVAGDRLDELGILIDFDRVKKTIRRLCDELDSRMLVPAESPLLEIAHEDGPPPAIAIRFGTRRYAFPADDVVLLPLANTTVELFAVMLWRRLVADLGAIPGADALTVEVGETAGQSCAYRAPLAGSDRTA